MLFICISHPDEWEKIESMQKKDVQGVELRLDLFPKIDLCQIQDLIASSSFPLLLTLRSRLQGGKYEGSEKERESLIEELLLLRPAFFDLEYNMDADFLHRVLQTYPDTKFILSYHNFEETPQNLEEIYKKMSSFPSYGYKIATFAKSSNDALRMLLFAKKHDKVSVIPMGEKGQFARVLGPVCGNFINYASLQEGKEVVAGQLSVQSLSQIYGYERLGPHTRLYGLIGDPVSRSLGHIYHNGVFREKQLDRVYVKMEVVAQELATFFPLAQKLGFEGLSVTMPLKEHVLPFLQEIDPQAKAIGSINTIVFQKNRMIGTNTDGSGALDAIEKRRSVLGKKVVLIGAGGTARSIAFEAKKRGAQVFLCNRTLEKAQKLAEEVGCRAGLLSDMPHDCDILINCTPVLPDINFQNIPSSALAMDVVYNPRETPFLLMAQDLGCEVLYGEEMFLNQAVAQLAHWSFS